MPDDQYSQFGNSVGQNIGDLTRGVATAPAKVGKAILGAPKKAGDAIRKTPKKVANGVSNAGRNVKQGTGNLLSDAGDNLQSAGDRMSN